MSRRPPPPRRSAIRPSMKRSPSTARPARARRARCCAARLVHRLMQSLPDIPPDARGEAHGNTRPAEKGSRRCRAASDVEQVLASSTTRASPRCSRPAAAPKFPSRATSPAARVRRGGPPRGHARGRADRRLQNQPPGAANLAETRTAMRLREATRALPRGAHRLYPGRPVRAALVWTERRNCWNSREALDCALANLTSP